MQRYMLYLRNCQSQLYNKLITVSSFLGMVLMFLTLSSCQKTELNNMDQEQAAGIKDSVQHMAAIIELDVSQEGPKAWLRHFSHSPEFFMASEGKLVFPNNDSATAFVNRFATQVRSIQLSWSDLNVEPLTISLAVMRASFHEIITDTSGHQMHAEGYFTGLAEHNALGWQLRNLHWSTASQGH